MSGQHNFKRFAMPYTNKELAEIAHVQPSTMSGYRSGSPIPSTVILTLAEHFKCSTDKILGRIIPAEMLTEENFPTARPNVMFTVSERQQLKEAEANHKTLAFAHETLLKELTELKQQNTLLKNQNAQKEYVICQETEDKLNKCKALLSAIHLLSEEK